MFTYQTTCRACQREELEPVLNLGFQPLANDFQKRGGECAGYAPVKVLFCKRCTLAQLSVVVRPEIIYANYPYVTSTSAMMKRHFFTVMDDIEKELGRKNFGKLLEIGSNNGEFLVNVKPYCDETLGFEPAKNLAEDAQKRNIRTINRLFDTPNAIQLKYTGYKADVIVARHVFCHVDDWQGFIHAVELVSHADTLVYIEVPYVSDMFKNNSFDQCYQEHYSYMSIRAMVMLLKDSPFQVQKVIRYPIHGGSVGIFLRHRLHPRTEEAFHHLNQIIASEETLLDDWRGLEIRKTLMLTSFLKLLRQLKFTNHKVCGFGASAKATIWLNSTNPPIDTDLMAFICDSTPEKQGRLVPGTDIPVVPESELMQADYAVCLAWNFFLEIRERNKAFEEKGGKWILPVPDPHVVK